MDVTQHAEVRAADKERSEARLELSAKGPIIGLVDDRHILESHHKAGLVIPVIGFPREPVFFSLCWGFRLVLSISWTDSRRGSARNRHALCMIASSMDSPRPNGIRLFSHLAFDQPKYQLRRPRRKEDIEFTLLY